MSHFEERPTSAHILADGHRVLTRCDGAQYLDGLARHRLGLLEHHDRVGAGGQHAPRVDEDRLAGLDRRRLRSPHGDFAGQGQIGREGFRRAERVRRADCIAVHRAAREGRQGGRSGQGGGQHAPEGVGGGHCLRPNLAGQSAQQDLESFRGRKQCEHLGHGHLVRSTNDRVHSRALTPAAHSSRVTRVPSCAGLQTVILMKG